MEDHEIVALYWQRDPQAIAETQRQYGAFCLQISRNLLQVAEDAEECVNDTYYAAWTSMPTERPHNLRAWLGRVVRNLSIDRYRYLHRQKRYAGIESLIDELETCVPDAQQVLDRHELSRALDAWLRTLPPDDARLFIRRYWLGEALQDLAALYAVSPGRLAQKMLRLRRSLKKALEKEGYTL